MEKKRFLAGAVSIALALTMVSTSAFAVSVEFTDVPSSHWAHASISEMADKGIMSGVGNNKFAPDTTLTGAQFVTMIVRHFYEDKLGAGGDKWYSAFMDVAEKEGILADTSITAEGVINRYDMAQLMYNVLKAEGISATPCPTPPRWPTGLLYPLPTVMLSPSATIWGCSLVWIARALSTVMGKWTEPRPLWSWIGS